jgi:hypothetical protein
MTPIFKELKDKSDSAWDPNQPNLSKRLHFFGNCGSKSKTQLKKSTSDMDTKNEEIQHECFVTKQFPNQNPDNGGLNVESAKNWHTYTRRSNRTSAMTVTSARIVTCS